MKAKIFTYLFLCFCVSKVFSQEAQLLKMVAGNNYITEVIAYEFSYLEENSGKTFSLLSTGGDLYSLQVLNFSNNKLELTVNTRLEEELPYEAFSYEYNGFYYLDFGCSYNIGNLDLSFSIDNLLNLNSKDFSIDPNLETANGITNAFYLSHEADTLVSLTLAYNF